MKIAFIAAVMLALTSTSAPAAEAQGSRCLAPQPFCPWGQAPLCVCENDFSYNCIWMCASTR